MSDDARLGIWCAALEKHRAVAVDRARTPSLAGAAIDLLLRSWAASLAAEPRLRLRIRPAEDAPESELVTLDRGAMADAAGVPMRWSSRIWGRLSRPGALGALDVLGRVYGAVRDGTIDTMLAWPDQRWRVPIAGRVDLATHVVDEAIHDLLADFSGEEPRLLLEGENRGEWYALGNESAQLANEPMGPNGWRRRFCKYPVSSFGETDAWGDAARAATVRAPAEREAARQERLDLAEEAEPEPILAHAPATLRLSDELVAAVRDAYTSPGRAYHTVDHIREVVRWFSVVDEEHDIGWRQPKAVYLALLFHDAIYQPGEADNEVRSAELAVETISRLLPNAAIDTTRVAYLIQLTSRHGKLTPAGVDDDAALFLDCDMAILGADEPAFDAYDTGIAAEYPLVPPNLYRAGRRAFLEGLLGMQRIFLSNFFHTRLDTPARENLKRAIARLTD